MLDAFNHTEISFGRIGRYRQTAFSPFSQTELLVFLKVCLDLHLYDSFVYRYVFGHNCNGVTLRCKPLIRCQ